jgi:membrane-bound lytic murein transglycosylase B
MALGALFVITAGYVSLNRMSFRARLAPALLAVALTAGAGHASTDPAGAAAPVTAATAAEAPSPFQLWLTEFRRQAAEQGISQATLEAALTGLQPLDQVLERDRRQPEFLDTFQDYLAKRITETRLRGGQAALEQQAALLAEVERRYGIPGRYLVAFWGLETNYGAYQGDIPALAALATLAHDARRPEFFRGQLLDALRLIERGQARPADLLGSWAGALGHMQFIPSTWLAHAVDGDGDGRIDLRGSTADALHSAANYLRQAGWRIDEGWGLEVILPGGFDPAQAGLDRRQTIADWARLGVRRADLAALPESSQAAALILPQGIDGPAFLVTHNFQVIMRWNRSVHYALAVGHLADRLVGGPAISTGFLADNRRLSREQMEALQGYLAALGYDPGPADGIPGSKTQNAIRAYQAASGLPADGYPSMPLLERLRGTLLQQAQPLPDGRGVTSDQPV